MPTRYCVVLASGSPRRRDLLSKLIDSFTVEVSNEAEDSVSEDPFETAVSLAIVKAEAVARRFPDCLVIGGDTVVAYEESGQWHQLAKPQDEEDAVRMLGRLSGRSHVVTTGIALVWPEGTDSFHDRTNVTFRELTQREMQDYARTGEPLDKAGGYAIQGGAAPFVAGVEGSISNVVGLPLEMLEARLKALGLLT